MKNNEDKKRNDMKWLEIGEMTGDGRNTISEKTKGAAEARWQPVATSGQFSQQDWFVDLRSWLSKPGSNWCCSQNRHRKRRESTQQCNTWCRMKLSCNRTSWTVLFLSVLLCSFDLAPGDLLKFRQRSQPLQCAGCFFLKRLAHAMCRTRASASRSVEANTSGRWPPSSREKCFAFLYIKNFLTHFIIFSLMSLSHVTCILNINLA